MNKIDDKWTITYNSDYNGRLVMLRNGVIGRIIGYDIESMTNIIFRISTKNGVFMIPESKIEAFGVD